MKKLLLFFALVSIAFISRGQFVNTDALRAYNDLYTTNSAIKWFTNMRGNTLLRGIIDHIDSAKLGLAGFVGVDTAYALNDSTLRYRRNGVFYNVMMRGTFGGGSTESLSNAGAYDLVKQKVDFDYPIKGLSPGLAILIDSSATNLTLRVDTSASVLKSWFQAGANITLTPSGPNGDTTIIASTGGGGGSQDLVSVLDQGGNFTANESYNLNAFKLTLASGALEVGTTITALNGAVASQGSGVAGITWQDRGNSHYSALKRESNVTFMGGHNASSVFKYPFKMSNSAPDNAIEIMASGALRLANLGADPSGSNGQVYYDSVLQKFRGYQAGAWTNLIGAGGAGGTLEDAITAGPSASSIVNFLHTGDSNAANLQYYVTPNNYDVLTNRGRFMSGVSRHDGVNADGRPNVVWSWGYNITPGGGREISTEAAFRFGQETHFQLEAGNPAFEFHLPEITSSSGIIHRPFSMYIRKVSGYTEMNSQIDSRSYKKVTDANFDWMIFSQNTGENKIRQIGELSTSVIRHTMSLPTHLDMVLTYDATGFGVQADIVPGKLFYTNLPFVIGQAGVTNTSFQLYGNQINREGYIRTENTGANQTFLDFQYPVATQKYLFTKDDANFSVPIFASAGLDLKGQLLTSSTGNLTVRISPKLSIEPNATDASFLTGGLSLQSYGTNDNTWVHTNAYFNGANYKHKEAGYSASQYVNNGQFAFQISGVSGAADATYTPKIALKIGQDSTVGIGGNMTLTAGSYTGARLIVDGTSGALTASNLAGTGTRMVVAQATGLLSATAGIGGTTGTIMKKTATQETGNSIMVETASPNRVSLTGQFAVTDQLYLGPLAADPTTDLANGSIYYNTTMGKGRVREAGAWVNFITSDAAAVVTSVALSMPSGFSVSGSPITTSGTLGVTTTLNGPLSGNGSGFVVTADGGIAVTKLASGSNGQILTTVTGVPTWTSPAGGGNVTGPASASNSGIVEFDGISGTLLKQATGTGFYKGASGVGSFQAGILDTDLSANIPLLNAALNTFTTKMAIGTGDMTNMPNPTRFQSVLDNASASGSVLNGAFRANQTVATTGNIQAMEGYTTTSNASGAVVLAIGTIGNFEHKGAGVVTWARGVQGGVIINGGGTITDAASIFANPVNIVTGAGIVTRAYGLYVGNFTAGSGTITNKYNIYTEDASAINRLAGTTRIVSIAGTGDRITGVNAGGDLQAYVIGAGFLLNAGTLSVPGATVVGGIAGQVLTKIDGTNYNYSWQNVPAVPESDGDKGEITVASGVWTIDASSVAYGEIQNMSGPNKILGRYSAGVGPVQELTISTGLNLDASGNLTASAGGISDGDKGSISVTGSGEVWTIDPGAVTEAMHVFTDITTGNATTSAHGFMPKFSGNASHVLRGDGIQSNILTTIAFTAGGTGAGTAPITLNAGAYNTTATVGALEFDGKALGFVTQAGARGIIQAVQFSSAPAAHFTLAAASGVQPAFPATHDVLTVEANTTYFFDGIYFLSTGTTTHTTAIAFALGGGATVASFEYYAMSTEGAANTTQTTQRTTQITGVASFVLNATTTSATMQIRIWGVMRVTNGGTITPQISFSANPGGTNLMRAGSRIRFTPVGTDAVIGVGEWN